MKDKKKNRATLVTLGVSLLLIVGVCVVLILYFRGLQTGDSDYTLLVQTKEAESTQSMAEEKDVPLDDAEDESTQLFNPEITDEDEADVEPVQTEDLAMAKRDRIAKLEQSETLKVIREFTVNEQAFCQVEMMEGTQPDPAEVSVTAEAAAEAALKAWQEMVPDNQWEGPFQIRLAYMEANSLYGDAPTEQMALWIVDTIIPQNTNNPSNDISQAIVNPESGEIISLTCPRNDNAASTVKDVLPNEVYFSLMDFLMLSDDNTWITQGTKLIRKYELGDTVNGMIVFDEEKGIYITHYGDVLADFYVGKGADAQKIKIIMDLYTKELIGYTFYDRF